MKCFHSAFFVLLLLLINFQSETFSQSEHKQEISYLPGKLSFYNSDKRKSINDSVQKKSTGKVTFKMKKSPWKAVALSAVLPGAGQFYNESYWKIPVIAGLGGYFVYEWIQNNNQYLDYKELYQNSQTPQNPSGNLQLQSLREFYRDQRDNFIIYSLILYVVNLLDAYVDAQLFDFDVSDSIYFGVMKKEKFLKMGINF